ncbi:uncharacterized protein LOC115440566 [Manduca sexta]|uniref:Uncharacterized protein n=1 Tax=Manduca sexta TaxID=7130 RepID=A0A922CHA9_MANSE|nr:uncharacterized protein LOC115440566 [Manduca sexta]KAG6445578.1 hypothetical protein O3G_MSEX003988 [Manduca sexta]
MFIMIPNHGILPYGYRPGYCINCGAKLDFSKIRDDLKQPPEKKEKGVGSDIKPPSQLTAEDTSDLFQLFQRLTKGKPANKPATRPEAVTNGIGTTATTNRPISNPNGRITSLIPKEIFQIGYSLIKFIL